MDQNIKFGKLDIIKPVYFPNYYQIVPKYFVTIRVFFVLHNSKRVQLEQFY